MFLPLKAALLLFWEKACGAWKKRIVRGMIVLLTALGIGQFGAWLIESSRWLGVRDAEIPKSTSRGVERFFDGKTFDPANPKAYLASLAIRKVA